MPAIIYSNRDEASFLIGSQLKRHYKAEPRHADYRMWALENDAQLIEISVPPVQAEDLQIESDYLIFACRHSGASGKPSLTVHTTGNWGAATLVGGRPREVSYPQASAMKHAFLALHKLVPPNYEVAMEATHHGPTSILSPMFFIELGSGTEQWRDPVGAKAVADAIVMAVSAERESQYTRIAFGIGGGHYCPYFTKIERESEWAFAHILPDYAFDDADEAILTQALEKSGAELIVIDWKGLISSQRERAIKFAEGAGVEWQKAEDVERVKTGDVEGAKTENAEQS